MDDSSMGRMSRKVATASLVVVLLSLLAFDEATAARDSAAQTAAVKPKPDQPGRFLSRVDAHVAVHLAGINRTDAIVEVRKLKRTSRNSFRATIVWPRRVGTVSETCSIRLSVRLRLRKRFAFTWLDAAPKCVKTAGPVDPFQPDLPIDPDNPSQSGPGAKFCPGTAGSTWDARADLIGKTLEQATAIAREHGCSTRPVMIDGVDQVVTADFSYSRINVAIEGPDQRVVAIDSVA